MTGWLVGRSVLVNCTKVEVVLQQLGFGFTWTFNAVDPGGSEAPRGLGFVS